MKKISVVTLSMVAAILAAVPLHALAGGNRVRVEVPFAFSAGSASLPAGEYTIQRGGSHHLLIRDRHREVLATVYVAGGVAGAGDARVTFRRYGHRSFLGSVSAPGFGTRDVRPSLEERRLAADVAERTRYSVDVDATIAP